jgi:dihydrolipoamide dehydrogenase
MKNIIIGSGPAGRLAGLELGKLGKEALLIEKEYIAGNCLNEGCMVICALSDIAKFLNNKKRYENLGLIKGNIKISYSEMINKIKETQEVIRKIHKKENESVGNEIIFGEAKVEDDTVIVNGESFEYENLLIATGAKSFVPNIKGKEYALTSKDLLKIDEIPEKLTIIGGGPIAIEISSLFASFGSEVSIINRGKMLSGFDLDLKDFMFKNLLKDIKIYENQSVIEIRKNKVITVTEEFEGTPFIATGRTPNSKIVENVVELDNNAIKVNKMMRTNVTNIYAAGDVIGGINLTTVARMEGITAARNMAGYSNIVDYKNVPQGLTLDMDVAYNMKREKGEEKINSDSTVSMVGSAGSESFWRVLTNDTGISKVLFNPRTKKIKGISAISPSAVNDVAYMSYLIKNKDIEDFTDEFVEIHPSTDIFHSILKEIYL